MPLPNNLNTVNSLTDKHFIRKIEDDFFLNSYAWYRLREEQETFDGGNDIRRPIQYAASTNGGAWGGGSEQLQADFQDNVTMAVWNICQYYSSMNVPQTFIWQNAGKSKIDDILKTQSELMLESFNTNLGADLFGDGSLSANGKKRLDGMQAVCTSGADPSFGPYGGITRVGSSGTHKAPVGLTPWWNSPTFAANAGAVSTWKDSFNVGAVTTFSLPLAQAIQGMGTANMVKPELYVTTQPIYNAFGNLLQQYQRQMTSDQTFKGGFKGLEYAGAMVQVDDNCPTGEFYGINFEYLKLYMHNIADFYATEFRSPANQATLLKYVFVMCNLICSRPNTIVRCTGITG